MKKNFGHLLLFACVLWLSGCEASQQPSSRTEDTSPPQHPFSQTEDTVPLQQLSSEPDSAAPAQHQTVQKAEPVQQLQDLAGLYSDYDSTDPVCFYVTVLGGTEADGTNHTLEEVNSYLNLQGMYDVEKIKTGVLLQVGDEEGPLEGEIGYGGITANASMNVRGRTSTGYAQKSYRITLNDNAGFWRGQRAIALNKHPADVTRIRNMLYFSLLQRVPSMISLRTQFVHLYVKDLTAQEPEDAFVDYGLYTQVELPNNRFLRNHGLSVNGSLYKANMCEMYRYPDELKLVTDPDYDASAFSRVFESKTGDDHTKLLEMLDAVNDYTIPIEEIVDTYFDIDNLTSYLAFNLLMGNEDSNAQNYFLYSPVNSSRWYYLCWDGDGCLHESIDELLGDDWQVGAWTRGVSNYWGVVLFNRLLRLKDFRSALSDKIDYLRTVITPELAAEQIEEARTAADRFTSTLPDSLYLKADIAQLEEIYEALPGDLERSYQYYLDSLEKPMPFYMGDAKAEEDSLLLTWGDSFDFDGEFLRYHIELSEDWSFQTVLWEEDGILDTHAELPLPEPGEYYWRASVTNESGETQEAFDQVITSGGAHHSMRHFTVLEDGTVVNQE